MSSAADAAYSMIRAWHEAAALPVPRLNRVPDSWLRTAVTLAERGITADDLGLVARWMRAELRRSQAGERNSVAFNAASFAWPKMFPLPGSERPGDEFSRFLGMLTLAEAARPATRPAPMRTPPPAAPLSPEHEQRLRATASSALAAQIERMKANQ